MGQLNDLLKIITSYSIHNWETEEKQRKLEIPVKRDSGARKIIIQIRSKQNVTLLWAN